MIKKLLSIITISFLANVAFAQTPSTSPTRPVVTNVPDQPKIQEKCVYEDKTYSEGSLKEVGKVTLICVERDWGITQMDEEKKLVWEPITSQRLKRLREITGLESPKRSSTVN